MLTTGWMIIISLFAGITIPVKVDKAKFGSVENVVSGPHYPSFLRSNIIVADSSVDEYCMWTQMQECLAYNQTVGGLEFVCDNFTVGYAFDVFQTDSNFSFTVTDEFVYSAQLGNGAYSTAIAGVRPYISFSYLISAQWGGMGAQYESGGWYSSFWDYPVDVGTGDVNTHKCIGKQLPDGNILFIGVATGPDELYWSTYTPDLSTRLAGGVLAPETSYYWGFDINGGIAYVFYYSDSLYYKTTTDGITWSPPQTYDIIWPQPFQTNILYWHQMALTDAGNPILVFDIINGNDQEYPYEGKVYVSTAPGQPCIEVGNPWTGAVNFYPTIATGGNYVVVLFLSPRSGSGLNTFWDIYYNYSTDNGNTWHTWPMNLTSSITDHNNSLPQIAKRLDASLNRFFFAFGHYIPYPYYDPIYNILNSGSPYPCRWYVGYNRVVPGIEEAHRQKPKKINLIVSPNPIVNRAVISYTIPATGVMSLKLYSADGRLVKVLEQGYRLTGDYTSVIGRDELPAGTYFLILETKNYKITHPLVIVH